MSSNRYEEIKKEVLSRIMPRETHTHRIYTDIPSVGGLRLGGMEMEMAFGPAIYGSLYRKQILYLERILCLPKAIESNDAPIAPNHS
jgi:hypothetical protein